MPQKTYLRYEPCGSFGVVVSGSSNIVTDEKGQFCVCGALQDVVVWNLNTEIRSHKWTLQEGGPEVSRVAVNAAGDCVCAGYTDGRVAQWNLRTGEKMFDGKGHRKAVSALTYSRDGNGALIASGGRDTNIVVWDTIRGAGEFRLRGHNDEITDVVFVSASQSLSSASASSDEIKYVVSSSKDTLLKVWDLKTQHCIQTLVGHRCEIWSLAIHPTRPVLMTAASDRFVRMWTWSERTNESNAHMSSKLELAGTLHRSAGGRAVQLRFNASGTHLACQGSGKGTDLWRMRDEEKAQKKMKRRLQRRREKARKKQKSRVAERSETGGQDTKRPKILGGEDGEKSSEEEEETPTHHEASHTTRSDSLTPGDWFDPVVVVRTKVKAQSFSFAQGNFANETVTSKGKKRKYVGMVYALQNNAIGLYRVRTKLPNAAKAGTLSLDKLYSMRRNIGLQGHRAGVRAVALSHDNSLVVSVSSKTAKVWRVGSVGSQNRAMSFSSSSSQPAFECIRTIDTGYGLCVAFVSGDRHVVVGTKSGALQLLSLSSAEVIRSIEDAHEGSIWSLAMRPDRAGFATGAADNLVKMWEFDVESDHQDDNDKKKPSLSLSGGNRLTVVHTRTLKMSDEILCVRYSHAPNDKLLLAVALLDSTVKIFYEDTLKFHISLYGHKLPVMSMDISSDDALLVTASSDKDVKLWGLEFGDCHKSIFAHNGAVTSVAFVRGTHYFFSCGKDGVVKYFDGDTYDMILELRGHCQEAWGCVVSNDGEFVVSCSHDRSLRVWERTQDQVFIEEEAENRMETLFFEEAIDRHAKSEDAALRAQGASNGGVMIESEVAGKKTIETVKTAERLIESIELVLHEQERQTSSSSTSKNPLLLGLSPLQYTLRTLRRIRASELEQALLVLPFHLVEKLLRLLSDLAKRNIQPELISRVVIFLLRLHHAPITASRVLRPVVAELRRNVRSSLKARRDVVGFNIAGFGMLKQIAVNESMDDTFIDTSSNDNAESKKRKR